MGLAASDLMARMSGRAGLAMPRLQSAGRSLPRLPQRLLATGVEGVMTVALAWILVQMLWVWTQPVPLGGSSLVGSTQTAEASASRVVIPDFDPFNRAASITTAAVEETVDAPETLLDLKLYGVRAYADPEQGSAIIRLPSHSQKPFEVGQTVLDGVSLVAVFSDRVVLRRGRSLETLSLPERERGTGGIRLAKDSVPAEAGAAKAPGPSGAAIADAAPKAAAEPAPRGRAPSAGAPGGPVQVSVETGEELLRILTLKPRFSGGGMSGMHINVRDGAQLPEGLGIRPGDVLLSVNGIELTSQKRMEKIRDRLEDERSVSLEIERDGQIIPLVAELEE